MILSIQRWARRGCFGGKRDTHSNFFFNMATCSDVFQYGLGYWSSTVTGRHNGFVYKYGSLYSTTKRDAVYGTYIALIHFIVSNRSR